MTNRSTLLRLTGLVMWAHTASAATTVTSDFDFDDNTVPAAFATSFGSGPTTGGGVLTFDGTTAIQAPTNTIYGGSAPTDNYGYEVIVTPTAFNAFDLIAAIVDNSGSNTGSILYTQPNYGLIEAGEVGVQGTIAPGIGTTVSLALVMDGGVGRLYVNGGLDISHAFSASGPTPIVALDTVMLGGNLFDGAAGAYNGTVDRARYFTFDAGTFDAANLLGPGDGSIPEPSALALLGLGSLTLLRRRRS